MKKLIMILSLVISSGVQANELVAGDWINNDKATRSVVKLSYLLTPGSLVATTYASCKPVPCDWGMTNVTELENGDLAFGYVFQHKSVNMVARLNESNQLQVTVTTTYFGVEPRIVSSELVFERPAIKLEQGQMQSLRR